VVRNTEGIFVIYAVCTHLGCTPDWKAAENKFKCPCHGSGYDSEGVNFEGPAPRPMDRAHVDTTPDGQIEVDVSRLYRCPRASVRNSTIKARSFTFRNWSIHMPEKNGTDGPNGAAGNGSDSSSAGGNGAKKRVAVIVEGAKAVRTQATEEIKALKHPEKTDLWEVHAAGQARRDSAQPGAGRIEQCLSAFASGQDQPRRGGLQIYVGHGRHDVLRLHHAGFHRHSAHVLLSPSKIVAFRDILYLEHDVPFGKLLRNMHAGART